LRLRGRVVVFMQNRYLIDDVSLSSFPLRIRLRLELERLWFSTRMVNADGFIVQTPTMKHLMESATKRRTHVLVLPFVAAPHGYQRSLPASGNRRRNAEFDFAYVATGEPHKNHHRLISAWCLLAREGLFPTLCLTLNQDHFGELCAEIDTMKHTQGIRVINAGELSHTDALGLYEKAGALIYPSVFESFGMPLIEARQAELPILASELDYVRDVVDPEETFDPQSPTSIARAVKRFMGIEELPLPLQDAKSFLQHVIGMDG
jgi:glycosyltransferase involved in cell wall biosynthesis